MPMSRRIFPVVVLLLPGVFGDQAAEELPYSSKCSSYFRNQIRSSFMLCILLRNASKCRIFIASA